MRKTRSSVVVLMLTFCSAMASVTLAALPLSAAISAGAMQAQPANAPLSPEAQQKLIKKVQSALLKLPYYGVYDWLQFEMKGRTVILQGQVLRSSLKPDAEHAVKKIEGVENVVNNIEVLPPGGLDNRLRRQIHDAVYSGPLFRYSTNQVNPPIHILVRGGHVTLEGVVDTETDKNLVTMRANQVPGAVSVTNNLRVSKG